MVGCKKVDMAVERDGKVGRGDREMCKGGVEGSGGGELHGVVLVSGDAGTTEVYTE